jgi:uncharacterized protein (TIGR03437 family)
MRFNQTVILLVAATSVSLSQTKLSWVNANLIYNAASWESVDVPGGGLAPGSEFTTLDVPWFISIGGGTQCPEPARFSITIKPLNGDALTAKFIPTGRCSQVHAILPAETPVGPADLTFSISGQTIQTVRIEVVPTRFGIFTREQGQGAAIAQNYGIDGQFVTNGLLTPALRGQVVTIWGTGLGPNPVDVVVRLGKAAIQPDYAGPAPGLPGIDQINFAIPSGVANGCYVPVQVELQSVLSNLATIAKGDTAGPCVHPLGLSAATLAALDAGQSMLVGNVSIGYFDRSAGPGSWLPPTLAAGQFNQVTVAGIQALSGSLADNDSGLSCRLGFNYHPGYYPLPWPPLGADFGSQLFPNSTTIGLEGPGNQVAELQIKLGQPTEGYLSLPGFTPGDWHISLANDRYAVSLSSTVTLPPPLQWLNRPDDFSAIDRKQDLTVQWNADGYGSTDIVTVGIEWEEPYAQNIHSVNVRSLDCTAPVSAGAITIPSSWLIQIPPSPTFPDAYPHTLTLSLRQDFAHRQKSVLTNAGSLTGIGLVGYAFSQAVWVNLF